MRPNFKILDGLRGIAATYVLVNHSRGNLLMGGNEYAKITPVEKWSLFDKFYYSILQTTSLGREFVILFFILSGFSIAYSLQKKATVLEFYERRLLRLYPPYLIALIWAAVVFYITKQLSPVLTDDLNSVFSSPNNIISNLLYVPQGAFIGQFWSLTYEVIFYLLIPFCIFNKRYYYIISLILYGVSIFISWKGVSGNNILSMYLLDYNIYFAIGVWVFHNYKKVESLFFIKKDFIFYGALTGLFLLMVVVKFKTSEYNKVTLLIAVLFSILLIVNFLCKEICNWLLSFLGSMSYTLYITHLATIFLFKSILLKTGAVSSNHITTWYIWIVGVGISIFASWLLYYTAENPSKKILSKFRK
jgi:peptidoglycan/LPS O-acetylase OafA/YrhL